MVIVVIIVYCDVSVGGWYELGMFECIGLGVGEFFCLEFIGVE